MKQSIQLVFKLILNIIIIYNMLPIENIDFINIIFKRMVKSINLDRNKSD